MIGLLQPRMQLPAAALLACLLAAGGGVSRAQAPVLTLAEAIRSAVARDPRGAAQAARRNAAEARHREALFGYAPDVLLGAAYTDGFPGSGSNLRLRGMLGSPFFRSYAAGVDVSWEITDLLRAYQAASAAQAQVRAEDALRGTVEREAALAVIDLFERVLTAQALAELLHAEAQARRAEEDALRARVDAGIAPRTDLLQLAAAQRELQADLGSAQADAHAARRGLHALTDDPRALHVALALTGPASGVAFPEVQAAQALREQADALRKQRSLELVPRLTLGGSAGYAHPQPGAEPGYYAAGVSFALPLTSALRERTRREGDAALIESRAAELDAVLQKLAIRTAELDGAIEGLAAALPAAAESTRASQQSLDALLARAAAGAVRQIEVEAARIVLRRAETRERTLRIRLEALQARRAYVRTRPLQ